MRTKWRHGTISGYNGGRCRCAECSDAHRAYQAERVRGQSPEARAKRNAYLRDYHAANRQRLNALARERRAADPERYNAKRREWQRGNPEYLVRTRDRRYGLAPGQFDAMLVGQDGRCAICRFEFEGATPQVDHDHNCCPGQKSCGKCVRALLCSPCNQAIGLMGEDPERVRRAAAYLELPR